MSNHDDECFWDEDMVRWFCTKAHRDRQKTEPKEHTPWWGALLGAIWTSWP